MRGWLRGHAIEWNRDDSGVRVGDALYCDTLDPVEGVERPCASCGVVADEDAPDPCLGSLPGVTYACCGHGVRRGYIRFENGTTLRFPDVTVERP